MYQLSITLNEPNEELLILRQGDEPLLKLTVYDHDGSDWPDGYDAVLYVSRSNRDPDMWTITGIAGDDDNEWFFPLEDVTYTIGDYDMILELTHDADETTPVCTAIEDDTTPVEDEYSYELKYTFLPIPMEVR